MGLLSSLFGTGKARKELQNANAQSSAQLAAAQATSTQALTDARGQARGDLNAGIDAARGAYDAALPGMQEALAQGYGGAIDAVGRGLDTARGDLAGAGQGAETSLLAGLAGARGDLSRGYGMAGRQVAGAVRDANSRLDPYAQSGELNQGRLDAVLGGDTAGYGSYRDAMQPYLAYGDQRQTKDVAAGLNARGISGGRALTAQSRVMAEREEGRVRDYMTRLDAAAGRGQQAAGQQSSNTMQGGQMRAGLSSGLADRLGTAGLATGQQVAGVRQQTGRDLAGAATGAATQEAGLRQGYGGALSDLGGQFAGARANLEAQRGGALANIATGTGTQLANLGWAAGQQGAANTINFGNAMAQTQTQGMQSLINLLGVGANAYGALSGGNRQTGGAGQGGGGLLSLLR